MDGPTLQDIAMRIAARLAAVTHTQPFGPEYEVFKVVGKVFLMTTDMPGTPIVTLKCEPLHGKALQQVHKTITPGYHMNKRHWISIAAGEGITEELVHELVTNAYELVVEGLPKDKRPIQPRRCGPSP